MGKHKISNIEELRVNAVKSYYHFTQYKKALAAAEIKEEIKNNNFNEFLNVESEKCLQGNNKY